MRANAPITALLALAALSLISAPVEARTHKKVEHPVAAHSAHKTRAQADATPGKHSRSKSANKPGSRPHSKPTQKAGPAPKHRSRHHRQESVEDSVPATITRIHGTPRKATTSDFLQAASTPTPEKFPATPQGPAAIKAPSHPEDLAPRPPANASGHRSQPPRNQSANHSASQSLELSPARATNVVSVIRPTQEHPALPSVQDVAATPVLLPSLYNKRGHLIVPPPLKGSHEILLRQNQVADRDGLDRIRDDEDILELRDQHLLVPVPVSAVLVVDERLPANRRYCRPWTAHFLSSLSASYYARFHTPLQVNSAVRTVEFQQHLLHINGNAAPADGDTASPHLTGQAIDLAKHGLTLTEIAWLRGYLLPLVQQGKVDVEEEFQQSCFHISVYKKYLPPSSVPRRNLASSRSAETTALASAVQ